MITRPIGSRAVRVLSLPMLAIPILFLWLRRFRGPKELSPRALAKNKGVTTWSAWRQGNLDRTPLKSFPDASLG